MSSGDIFWLLALIATLCGYGFFVLRGRTYGYRALANRTGQLLGQGADAVWLMYGSRGIGIDINLAHPSVWSSLNTGFLAYQTGQQLIIEFPWWNGMRPLLIAPVSQIDPGLATVTYAGRAYPAVRLDSQLYVLRALNVQDVHEIKRLLKLRDNQDGDALRTRFMAGLSTAGSTAVSVPPPATYARSPAWKIVRGALLYVFLPCFLLTAALILWAVLTKQPAFHR